MSPSRWSTSPRHQSWARFSVGGWPVFSANALSKVDPTKTKFVSFDTVPTAIDILKSGKVQVLLGQKYFGWGSESIRLLLDAKNGKKPVNPIVDSGVDVVRADNVDAYVDLWRKMAGG
jgi:ribose transport system substrate-binding protein